MEQQQEQERKPRHLRSVYRQVCFPVPVFDTFKDLQRLWGYRSNSEVLTRIVKEAGEKHLAP